MNFNPLDEIVFILTATLQTVLHSHLDSTTAVQLATAQAGFLPSLSFVIRSSAWRRAASCFRALMAFFSVFLVPFLNDDICGFFVLSISTN